MTSDAVTASLQARRAGNRTALAVGVYATLFVLSSEVSSIREMSPWAEDPFDLVMSIAALVVPFVAAVTFVRFQRWADAPEMPAGRSVSGSEGWQWCWR